MRSLFVKCCTMINSDKPLQKLDLAETSEYQLKKYDILYFQTSCKGKASPFSLAFKHDDK